VPLGRYQALDGIEALEEQQGRAARHPVGEHDVERVDVEQRQHADDDVALLELELRLPDLPLVREQVPVHEHGALGPAGRARRVLQQREAVLAVRHRRGLRVVDQPLPGERTRRRLPGAVDQHVLDIGADVLHGRQERLGDHDRAGARVGQDGRDLAAGERDVQRHSNEPRPQDPVERLDERRRVAGHERDPVAGRPLAGRREA
jgi:hypothetical protein